MVDIKSKIPTFPLLDVLKLHKHKDSFLILKINFNAILPDIFNFSQRCQLELALGFHGEIDQHFIRIELYFSFLVIYFIVVVLFNEQFCDEDAGLIGNIHEGQILFPGLLLLHNLLFVHLPHLLCYIVQLQLYFLVLQF